MMTQGDQEPAVSEEVTADVSEATTPPLNREQRRAQAKGKKSGTAIKPPLSGGNSRGPVGRGSGQAGQVQLPRTGHK